MLRTATFWKVLLIGLLLLPMLGLVREASAGINVWTNNRPEDGDIALEATPDAINAPQYTIDSITLSFVADPSGYTFKNAVLMRRCGSANYHWLTSERLSPNQQRYGPWDKSPLSGCSGSYVITNWAAWEDEIWKVCAGSSDSSVSSSHFYDHPNNRCYRVWRTSSGIGYKAVFDIAGKVTDADGAALSGVIISLNNGQSATTNSSGNYRFDNIDQGTYTLTASKSGYVFTPASYSVTGPRQPLNTTPDVIDQNFTALTLANPVIDSGLDIEGSDTVGTGSTISVSFRVLNIGDVTWSRSDVHAQATGPITINFPTQSMSLAHNQSIWYEQAATFDTPGTYAICGGYGDFVALDGGSCATLMVQPSVPPTPVLNVISNADGGGNYTVSWSSVSDATGYILQEATNSDFTGATTVYSGSNTSTNISDKAPGTYYYRVRASNAGGDSEWSNTQSVVVSRDLYETDDTCEEASTISTDGLVQQHTFHKQADEDWVIFEATTGTTYRIEAHIPPESPADVTLELHGQCAGLPLETEYHTFSPGVRLEFEAPTSSAYYLRWTNHDPTVFGMEVAYHVSVQALDEEAVPGALVIVAGRDRVNDPLQPKIHYAAKQLYQVFQAYDYPAERIYYLATNPALPGYSAPATAANLQAAITMWAAARVGPERPFTLYMIDHGKQNELYLDGPAGQTVSPAQVDAWLSELETAHPGLKVNVIVEACHSGSFIRSPQTVSKPGRVVISSTGVGNVAYASAQGAIFSDHFTVALYQGQSLYQSFENARWATQAAYPHQTPWLDDDGDGLPNQPDDGQVAATRGFAYAGTFSGDVWPPHIFAAVGPSEITQGQGVIRAEVQDDEQVDRVWAVIYPPSYRPPESGEELVSEVLPTIVLQVQGNDQFAATYTGFDELGVYRIVVYAEDEGGREARPVAVEVRTGWGVYLPLVSRQ